MSTDTAVMGIAADALLKKVSDPTGTILEDFADFFTANPEATPEYLIGRVKVKGSLTKTRRYALGGHLLAQHEMTPALVSGVKGIFDTIEDDYSSLLEQEDAVHLLHTLTMLKSKRSLAKKEQSFADTISGKKIVKKVEAMNSTLSDILSNTVYTSDELKTALAITKAQVIALESAIGSL